MNAKAEVCILLINWNGFEVTKDCLNALRNQSFEKFDIFLLDNGSQAEDCQLLKDYIANFKNVNWVESKENLGFANGANLLLEMAINQAQYKYLCTLNNDTVPDENWLSSIVDFATKNNLDMAASKQLIYSKPHLIDNCGLQLLQTSEILPIGARESALKFNQPHPCLCPSAGAGLYKISLFQKMGGFDPYFETCYEDAELGLRFALGGAKCAFTPNAIVKHKVSYSVAKTRTPNYGKNLQKNILFTYFSLWYTSSIIINLPLVLLRLAALLILSFVTARFLLLRSQYGGIALFLRDLKQVKLKRKAASHLRKGRRKLASTPFLGVYLKYFQMFIQKRNPTILE